MNTGLPVIPFRWSWATLPGCRARSCGPQQQDGEESVSGQYVGGADGFGEADPCHLQPVPGRSLSQFMHGTENTLDSIVLANLRQGAVSTLSACSARPPTGRQGF